MSFAHLQNGTICGTREEHPLPQKRMDSSGVPHSLRAKAGSCAPASSRRSQRRRDPPRAALAARAGGAGEGEGRRRPCSPGKKAVFVPGWKASARMGPAASVCAGEDGEGRSPVAVRPPPRDGAVATSRAEVRTPLAGQRFGCSSERGSRSGAVERRGRAGVPLGPPSSAERTAQEESGPSSPRGSRDGGGLRARVAVLRREEAEAAEGHATPRRGDRGGDAGAAEA
jgi:hypothetical protein